MTRHVRSYQTKHVLVSRDFLSRPLTNIQRSCARSAKRERCHAPHASSGEQARRMRSSSYNETTVATDTWLPAPPSRPLAWSSAAGSSRKSRKIRRKKGRLDRGWSLFFPSPHALRGVRCKIPFSSTPQRWCSGLIAWAATWRPLLLGHHLVRDSPHIRDWLSVIGVLCYWNGGVLVSRGRGELVLSQLIRSRTRTAHALSPCTPCARTVCRLEQQGDVRTVATLPSAATTQARVAGRHRHGALVTRPLVQREDSGTANGAARDCHRRCKVPRPHEA